MKLNRKLKIQLKLLFSLHNFCNKNIEQIRPKIHDLILELLAISDKYTLFNPDYFANDYYNSYTEYNQDTLMEYLALFCRIPSLDFKANYYLTINDFNFERISEAIKEAISSDFPAIGTLDGEEYVIDKNKTLNSLIMNAVIKETSSPSSLSVAVA